MPDLVASYQTKKAAVAHGKRAPEWGFVYDSHTGKYEQVEDCDEPDHE